MGRSTHAQIGTIYSSLCLKCPRETTKALIKMSGYRAEIRNRVLQITDSGDGRGCIQVDSHSYWPVSRSRPTNRYPVNCSNL
jgi:hypothetical protein